MAEAELAERRGEVDARLVEVEERQSEIVQRLSEMEKFRERVKGAMLVISVMFGTGMVGFVAELAGLI